VITVTGMTGVIKQVSISNTTVTATKNELLDSVKANDWGYILIPFKDSGTVVAMKALHNCVIVYGTTGVFALVPKILESMPTYTVMQLADVGIYSSTSVVGNENEHYFVDVTGRVWNLNSKFEATMVYFDDEFAAAVSGAYTIVGTLDAANNRMYLSVRDASKTGGTYDDPNHLTDKSLVFSETGVSEVREAVCDIYTISATRAPFGYSTGQWDAGFYLKTYNFDFGTTEVKTFRGCKIQADNYTAMSVRLWFQAGPGATWRSTGWISVADTGDADFYVSGVTCYLEIKTTDCDTVRIYDIEIEYEEGKVLGTSGTFRRIV
jgi:hypothetical protein